MCHCECVCLCVWVCANYSPTPTLPILFCLLSSFPHLCSRKSKLPHISSEAQCQSAHVHTYLETLTKLTQTPINTSTHSTSRWRIKMFKSESRQNKGEKVRMDNSVLLTQSSTQPTQTHTLTHTHINWVNSKTYCISAWTHLTAAEGRMESENLMLASRHSSLSLPLPPPPPPSFFLRFLSPLPLFLPPPPPFLLSLSPSFLLGRALQYSDTPVSI